LECRKKEQRDLGLWGGGKKGTPGGKNAFWPGPKKKKKKKSTKDKKGGGVKTKKQSPH